jgi:acetylornithine deacetylase/succinyl-diaminopimelate desuccinylase-like protein
MPHQWEQYLIDHEEQHLNELKEFLRIPSVSALLQHKEDMRRAAEWLAQRLRQTGVPQVTIFPTQQHPVVYGHWPVSQEQPTVMIYGHYDVQPPDPLDRWESPPFEPMVRHGRIYARGASDDKGNLLAAVHAVEALAQTQGVPPVNLKFFCEGEEEINSPSLPGLVQVERERLHCDFVLSADGVMYGPATPSLTIASKGLVECQIDLRTAPTDLHSGMYGAVVPNAIQALVQLVASLHTPTGRVAVEGFYDRVRELTAEERAAIAAVPFDEEEYRQSLGVSALWGEPDYTVPERLGSRPTLDLHGIWGGFQGEGAKTVTPCEAHVKLSCRLVPDQDPQEIFTLIQHHILRHCPLGAEVNITLFPGPARPFAISRDHPGLQVACTVLHALYGKAPLDIRLGGTLPIAEIFQRELGVDTVCFAWTMPDNQMHAPNEWFRLEDFRMARRAYCAYLTALAK